MLYRPSVKDKFIRYKAMYEIRKYNHVIYSNSYDYDSIKSYYSKFKFRLSIYKVDKLGFPAFKFFRNKYKATKDLLKDYNWRST